MQQIGEIAKNYADKNKDKDKIYADKNKNYADKDKKGKEQPLKINAIPNNMEKYMAFMLGNHLTFLR